MANNGTDFLAKLLPLWAYVDNQDIWFEFLRLGDSDYPVKKGIRFQRGAELRE